MDGAARRYCRFQNGDCTRLQRYRVATAGMGLREDDEVDQILNLKSEILNYRCLARVLRDEGLVALNHVGVAAGFVVPFGQ